MKYCLLLVILLSVIFDQLSKYIISQNFILGQSITLVPNFFALTFVKNSGASFSILEGKLLFFIIMTIVALALFIYSYWQSPKLLRHKLIYGLLLGGSLGNFIDRIIRGSVIDFLDFHLFSYNFPVFNLADIFICLGAFFWILLALKEGKK